MKFLDAHHHFWDIESNYHPWLCDEPQIPFRYGNYADIRTNYLPKDFDDDTAQFQIIGSVHVEAEWNPEDPVGETRWLTSITQTCKHPVVFVVQARLEQYDIEEVLSGHSPFPQVRGIRHKPTATAQNATKQRGLPGSMDDPNWRKGYALLERFEATLEATPTNLMKASIELARQWRTDRALRRLEALMIVADRATTLMLSGQGDVIEPPDGVCSIGSGGTPALAAARALLSHTKLDASEICKASLGIAADICIYTNTSMVLESL